MFGVGPRYVFSVLSKIICDKKWLSQKHSGSELSRLYILSSLLKWPHQKPLSDLPPPDVGINAGAGEIENAVLPEEGQADKPAIMAVHAAATNVAHPIAHVGPKTRSGTYVIGNDGSHFASWKEIAIHAAHSARASFLVAMCCVLAGAPTMYILEWAASNDPIFCAENGDRDAYVHCPSDEDVGSDWHSRQLVIWVVSAMSALWYEAQLIIIGYVASKRFNHEPRALAANIIDFLAGTLTFNILAAASLAATPATDGLPVSVWFSYGTFSYFVGSLCSLTYLGKKHRVKRAAVKALVIMAFCFVMNGFVAVVLNIQNQFVAAVLTGAVYPFLEVCLKFLLNKTVGGHRENTNRRPASQEFDDWKFYTHSTLMELALQMPNTILIMWTMADNSRFAFGFNMLTVFVGEVGGVVSIALLLTPKGRLAIENLRPGGSSRVATLSGGLKVMSSEKMKLLAVKFACEEFAEKLAIILAPFTAYALSRSLKDEPLDLRESLLRMSAAILFEVLVVDMAKSEVLERVGINVSRFDVLTAMTLVDVILITTQSVCCVWVILIAFGPLQMEHSWF